MKKILLSVLLFIIFSNISFASNEKLSFDKCELSTYQNDIQTEILDNMLDILSKTELQVSKNGKLLLDTKDNLSKIRDLYKDGKISYNVINDIIKNNKLSSDTTIDLLKKVYDKGIGDKLAYNYQILASFYTTSLKSVKNCRNETLTNSDLIQDKNLESYYNLLSINYSTMKLYINGKISGTEFKNRYAQCSKEYDEIQSRLKEDYTGLKKLPFFKDINYIDLISPKELICDNNIDLTIKENNVSFLKIALGQYTALSKKNGQEFYNITLFAQEDIKRLIAQKHIKEQLILDLYLQMDNIKISIKTLNNEKNIIDTKLKNINNEMNKIIKIFNSTKLSKKQKDEYVKNFNNYKKMKQIKENDKNERILEINKNKEQLKKVKEKYDKLF